MGEFDPKRAAEIAQGVQERMPEAQLFADREWRIATEPFPLDRKLFQQLDSLGRVILKFYQAANLLHRQSREGREPNWAAEWLDRGKPAGLLELQSDPALKNELPRVLRPDVLLTEEGFSVSELDNVPGGIGLTAWLNQTYSELCDGTEVIGGASGMLDGFDSIFGDAPAVHLVVSEESETYRPEMQWLADEIDGERYQVQDSGFENFKEGDAVYRFFELFDLPNIEAADALFSAQRNKEIQLTPPPKPSLEEKMMFALFWNRNLRDFWHRELGEGFQKRLENHIPYSWVVDPAPLPPHGAIPELNLTDWNQLKTLSQKARNLILKISGFSEQAWGARGVHFGSDLPVDDWSAAVQHAIDSASTSPHILQRYHKPKIVESRWFDFETEEIKEMPGRVRLCPYYFVSGDWGRPQAKLGGVLATICPADKKIIHGMRDAIMAPCAVVD
jgi:hypothetical protein